MTFCVNCGIEGKETIDGLCMECFLNGRKLITMPHHIDLMRCANCEEYSINDQWLKRTEEEAVVDIALTQLMCIPEAKIVSVGTMVDKQEERTFVVHVQADVDVNGTMSSDEDSIIVRLKNTVCKRCSRQMGSYYEAILQIRTGNKSLDDDLRDEVVRWITATVETQSKTNRQLFIGKVQEVNGGVDVYLSSISLGKSLTRGLSDIYGAEVKESATLVGMTSDGQDMYRVTYLIRLPIYHTGDIVQYNDKPYKLVGLNKSGGKMMDLRTFFEMSVKKSDLDTLRIISKGSELREAVVLSSSGKEIQVMHPTNYSTKDLRIPADTEVGETVRVVEFEEELLFVP